MDINRNNYETHFLLYLDGELHAADREAVENFLSDHGDLQEEFRLLQNTIQYPAEIVFEQKESLYRKEEKRRITPVFWMRIAAAITLILAGSWFMLTISKNPKPGISGTKEALVTIESNKIPEAQNKNEVDASQKEGLKNEPDLKKEKSRLVIRDNRNPDAQDMSLHSVSANSAKRVSEQHQNITKEQKGKPVDQQNGQPISMKRQDQVTGREQAGSMPDETVLAMQKSSATLQLQTSGATNAVVDPGSLRVPGNVETPALAVRNVSRSGIAENENNPEPDLQTDNAISVVALNDRNKAITGFFKKIIKTAPADETAGNSKKLRVSVFQFSY